MIFPVKTPVIFRDYIFEQDDVYPYYSRFKGEVFMVESIVENTEDNKVILKCITDPRIKVDYPINTIHLEEA